MQLGLLVVLFVAFLSVPWFTKTLGKKLDSLPIRFAAVILILAMIPYDSMVALALFLVITAIYVQHHQNDLANISGTSISMVESKSATLSHTMEAGGHASETTDSMEFVPNGEEQDNKFEQAGNSIDEKHALLTEPLGSKAQGLFAEDVDHARNMENGNRNGRED